MHKKITMGLLALLLLVGPAMAGDFTDNKNGTVTDNVTGLMWQQPETNTARSLEAALAYCEGLALAGQEDWRLPNINELESITDDGRTAPAVDPTAFPGVTSYYYWSSTFYGDYGGNAWFVDFITGTLYAGQSTYPLYALCVRGGQ